MDSREIILEFLKENGMSNLENIKDGTGLARKTVSKHLKNLIDGGLVHMQYIVGLSSTNTKSYYGPVNGERVAKEECQYNRSKLVYEEFCKLCKRYDICF